MRSLLSHLRHVLVHKAYVFLECTRQGIPAAKMLHDMSKLLPGEISAYAAGMAHKAKTGEFAVDSRAWCHHVATNPHHWEYWVTFTNGIPDPSEMPLRYRKEMLADWYAMGRQLGKQAALWYIENARKIILGPETRRWVEKHLCVAVDDATPEPERMDLDAWATTIHDYAVQRGWWPASGRSLGDIVANVHAELSELWEAYRHGHLDHPCDKPIALTCEEEELADIIIRVLDYAAHRKLSMARAVTCKMAYNRNRPFRHGNLKA